MNGHRLHPIENTDTGWLRCIECARTAGGSSDDYWTKNGCNTNQFISNECWSMKRYMNLPEMEKERAWQLENRAIMDKEGGAERTLTEGMESRIKEH